MKELIITHATQLNFKKTKFKVQYFIYLSYYAFNIQSRYINGTPIQ